MKRSLLASLIFGAALGGPAALACDGYVPSMKMTHSGTVQSVDASAKTLTIRNAGSERPITFQVEPLMLVGLTPDESWVIVRYQQDGETLKALEIIR
ncbi:MAG: hypothetical protein R3286_12280 [Gammaproteobacteria bacterium]|nr:hypothetical protein [Gammaproteobacteria bacterium]